MNTLDFLLSLRARDIRIDAEGDRLRVNAPQGVITPKLRSELAERKNEILELFRKSKEPGRLKLPPVMAGPRGGIDLPLSLNQHRLWLLEQLTPGTPAYNIPLAYRLTGKLSIPALRRSLNEIVRRHDILRATFIEKDGQPAQLISSHQPISFPVIDLRSVSPHERDLKARQRIIEEALAPFNLKKGPLARFILIRLDDTNHMLLTVVHHIIFDAWSAGLFNQELAALYSAFNEDKPSPLLEPAFQYTDFVRWQHQWVKGNLLDSQLAYWKKALGDNPDVLELPADHPRPSVQTFRGNHQILRLTKRLTGSLRDLSRKEGVTLFMTLLASFKILLYRYTGRVNISVGSPIANRGRVEFERLIGFFVNTLVIRTDLSGMPTFREFLSQVRQVALGAYANQDVPFERLVEELQPERSMSHTPLFQVMFVLENSPAQTMNLPGLSVHSLELDGQVAKFDLSLYMEEEPDGIKALLEYNTDLFNHSTITLLLNNYERLLEDIAVHPDQKIGLLSIVPEKEALQIVHGWNQTASNYPRDTCIQELFARQADKAPDAVAVVYGERQLTYGQLNKQSNQLAHYLRRLGVGPEVLVGICMERSVEMVAGLLGILKAGGAYVPFDPEYPKERLAFMMEDTQVSVLLTLKRLVKGLPEYGAKVVCLDTDWGAISGESEGNLSCTTTAENLAYVMYTSGSTGRPKGICIPHRGVIRLIFNTDYVTLVPSDRVAQASNCSFDAATFEIWGALLQGARIVGVTRDVMLSPRDLAVHIRKQEISVLFLTTALFNQVVREDPRAFHSVRYLLFGGEAVDPSYVREVLRHGPPERLLHVYGPTESTTFASWHLLQKVPDGTATVPIGRPIANTQLYVLDRHLQPVPVGVPGELYVGGDGLARTYLNRSELTAEGFIPNPFSNEAGARMYKTGDLARYLSEGSIEFLGRIDHQVKIRGFRIELGEIEAVLCQNPSVREAVVLCWEDTPGEKRLVAYVTSHSDSTVSEAELRRYSQEKLPDYMVPSIYVILESMPLTSNGKVDRGALPVPDRVRPELEETFVAPSSLMEKMIAGIWREMLGVEQIGIYDDFFKLGGHSLIATQIISKLCNTFRLEIPLQSMFQAPTVNGMVNVIAEICGGREVCEEIAQTLKEVEQLSEDDAKMRLSEIND